KTSGRSRTATRPHPAGLGPPPRGRRPRTAPRPRGRRVALADRSAARRRRAPGDTRCPGRLFLPISSGLRAGERGRLPAAVGGARRGVPEDLSPGARGGLPAPVFAATAGRRGRAAAAGRSVAAAALL